MDVKVFVSLPMRDRLEDHILKRISSVLTKMEEAYPDIPFVWVDNYHKAVPNNIKGTRKESPWMLSDSLKLMALSDIVVFADGWSEARGCKIESEVCKMYDIPHILESQIGLMIKKDLINYIKEDINGIQRQTS
mgnify:CR=1 FL=1